MIVLAIDPGPKTSGVVAYGIEKGLTYAASKASIDDALEVIGFQGVGLVAIERVQSYGIPGGTLLETSEVVGRLQQRAIDMGLPVTLLYRREVLQWLDVAGKGNRDALVKERLSEMHGCRGWRQAVGTKKAPGPLYGVSGHAWSALAVAVVAVGRVS